MLDVVRCLWWAQFPEGETDELTFKDCYLSLRGRMLRDQMDWPDFTPLLHGQAVPQIDRPAQFPELQETTVFGFVNLVRLHTSHPVRASDGHEGLEYLQGAPSDGTLLLPRDYPELILLSLTRRGAEELRIEAPTVMQMIRRRRIFAAWDDLSERRRWASWLQVGATHEWIRRRPGLPNRMSEAQLLGRWEDPMRKNVSKKVLWVRVEPPKKDARLPYRFNWACSMGWRATCQGGAPPLPPRTRTQHTPAKISPPATRSASKRSASKEAAEPEARPDVGRATRNLQFGATDPEGAEPPAKKTRSEEQQEAEPGEPETAAPAGQGEDVAAEVELASPDPPHRRTKRKTRAQKPTSPQPPRPPAKGRTRTSPKGRLRHPRNPRQEGGQDPQTADPYSSLGLVNEAWILHVLQVREDDPRLTTVADRMGVALHDEVLLERLTLAAERLGMPMAAPEFLSELTRPEQAPDQPGSAMRPPTPTPLTRLLDALQVERGDVRLRAVIRTLGLSPEDDRLLTRLRLASRRTGRALNHPYFL